MASSTGLMGVLAGCALVLGACGEMPAPSDAAGSDARDADAARDAVVSFDSPPVPTDGGGGVDTPVVEPDVPSGADVPTTDGPPVTGDGGSSWNPPVETGSVMFPYRPYRCGYSIRAVSPGNPMARFHVETTGTAPAPRNLHLTFAGDPSTSVVIQWSTDADTLMSEVRFGDAMGRLDRIAHGYSFTYGGVTGRRQHEVHLCGLEPGHTYYYDAGGAGGPRSMVYHFVTAPAGASDVRVLVAGDSRTNPTQWGTVARRALSEGPDVMLLTGDAVATGTDQSLWDALFAASPELFATVPGLWSHGNHEGLAEPYFAQFALPDNGGARGNEQWYALTYGPMRVVALNDTVATATDISTAQTNFLRAELMGADRTRTPFVITMHHQPMYTTSLSHTSDTTIRGAWMPLFDMFHVNVDLAGHVHSYESTRPVRGGTASSDGTVVADAMGTRFFNYGGGGAPLYTFAANQPWIQTRESTRGYAIMAVSATRIQWTAKREDGTTIETITIPR